MGQMRKKNGTTEKKKMGPRGRNNRNGGKSNKTVEKRVALLGKKIGPPRKKWDNCGNKKMGLLEKANKDLNKVSYDSP